MVNVPAHIHLDAHKIAQEVIGAVRVEVDDFARNLRATIAEEIALAIEAEQVKCYPGSPRDKVFAKAAAIARERGAGHD